MANEVTLLDLMKLMDPDGGLADVAEVLHQSNSITKDAVMIMGNLPTGDQTTLRGTLGTASWKRYNKGTPITKGTTYQQTNLCGMMQAVSQIDYDLAKLNGNTAEWRWAQDVPIIEGIGQEAESSLLYANQKLDPDEITGFAPRYNEGSTSRDTNTTADYVIDGGGTGSDNTSIFLVTWGEQATSCIYPLGMKGGLETIDRGLVDLLDDDSNPYLGYQKYYKWTLGLRVKDYRANVRIANIDVSAMIADNGTPSTGADLISLMIKAMHRIPVDVRGRKVFYVNEDVETYLDLQTLRSDNVNVGYGKDIHGQPVMTFRGVPVRRSDSILSTESAVTFS